MRLISALLPLLLFACAGGDDKSGSGGGGGADTSDTGEGEQVSVLGAGDGSAASVGWTAILRPDEDLDDPRDLGFDAAGNLWVANRQDDRTFIISDPGTAEQAYDRRIDGYAMHFMEETAALSFDGGVQFGSCGESSNTYNDRQRGDGYMGPVLWSTDLNIFGVENPIGLGSHLDMSHESPLCVGIGWEKDNVYWAFDGKNDALVRHDFQADHGVGMDEHYDGIIHQLTEPVMTRVEEAPGHIVIDHEAGRLYVADTGGGRVLWLDIASGEEGAKLPGHDPGVERVEWDGADWGVVIEGLDRPGALAQVGDHLIVGEWGNGRLTEVDLSGAVVRQLETDFGAEALYAAELGPDGHLWVIDRATGVYRIDP